MKYEMQFTSTQFILVKNKKTLFMDIILKSSIKCYEIENMTI